MVQRCIVKKNGIVKIYWSEENKVSQETYRNLSEQEYQLLTNDENIEIVESEEFDDEKAQEQLKQVEKIAEAQGQK